MIFRDADAVSLGIFSVFAVVMLTLILRLFHVAGAGRTHYIQFGVLTIGASIFAALGIFEAMTIPLIPIFMAALFFTAIRFGATDFGRNIASSFSFAAIVGFQAFRLPLELILHHWAVTGVIPETMTWTGQNMDIIAGASAMLIAPFANRSLVATRVFQIIGSALLLNVVRVVAMSLPLPFSWHLENPLQLPFHFPYVLIAPLFIWPAILGHVVLFRKVLSVGRT